MNTTSHTHHGRKRHHKGSRLPHRIAYTAPAWSLLYGLVALVWTFTGRGFPLGENDPEGGMSMLQGLPADVGAPIFAAVAMAGAGIGLAMVRVRSVSPAVRTAILTFGVVSALGWLFVVVDGRVLALVGYLPMVLVVAPFDEELRTAFSDALTWLYVHHAAVLVGGFLWLAASVIFARRTARACVHCGRDADGNSRTATMAQRWAKPAVAVAMAVPAFYAATRWIWVMDIPLGIDEDFHAKGMASGDLWSGAWLGTFGVVGSLLTLGLVQRWGEIFPRWIPYLRGRRVPIKLAVIPASVVSVLVVSAGLGLTVADMRDGGRYLSLDQWAMIGPSALWPLWGAALATATYAYYVRRRGACGVCGRGEQPITSDGRSAPVLATPESR